MSNFISGTIDAVNSSIKYDDYVFAVEVGGATKLRNAVTQGTVTISGSLASNISASGGEMIALTSGKSQKGFLSGQSVGFVRAAINKCYQDANSKAVIVFNDNKISDFVCSESYATVQAILATSIFGGGSGINIIPPTSYANLAAQIAATAVGTATQDTTRKDFVIKDAAGDTITILGDPSVVVTASTGTSAAYNTTEYVTAAVTRTLPTAASSDVGKTITYKAVGAIATIAVGANTIDGASSSITIAAGDSITFAVRAANSVERVYGLVASSGSSGSTEYGITPSGSAGILIRIYGVASITAVKTNSSTITLTVPSVDGLQRADIYYPSAENAGANITLVVNYTSNTTTNQGFSTIKPAGVSMFSEAGLEYVPRASPAATDLSNTATATGGNLTHAIGGGNSGGIPAAIQTGNVKLTVKF